MNTTGFRLAFLPRIIYLLCSFILFSCAESGKQANVATIKLGRVADSLIKAESAGNPRIDSLQKKIDLAESDSSKLNLLFKIARTINYRLSDVIYSEIFSQARALKMEEAYIKASLAKQYNFSNRTNFDSCEYYHDIITDWAKKNDRKDIMISELLNYSLAFEMQKKFRESDSLILYTIDRINEFKLKDKRQKALAYYYLGKNKNVEFDNESALKYLKEAVKYAEEPQDNDLIADIFFRIGECYLMEADYNNSLIAYGNSVAYAQKSKDERTMSSALSAIGEIYVNKDDLKKAFENLFRSLELAKKTNYQYQEAYTSASLGSAFQADSNYAEAIRYLKESSKLYSSFNKNNHKSELLLNELNIGTVYISMKDMDNALSHLTEVYKQVDDDTEPSISSETFNNLSDVYYLKGDYNKAEDLAQKALVLSKANELTSGIQHSYEVLYKIYEKRKNFEKAHFYHKAFTKLTDSLTNKTQIKRFADLENEMRENQLKAEHDIKETSLRNEKLQKEEELAQQRVTSTIMAIGFIIILIFSVLIYRSLQKNKRQTKIISEQKKEVEKQKEIIEEKKKEVLDSIEYAKKIQEAILPPAETIHHYFPASFVLYRPKDIVAGDFYWLQTIGDKVMIAVGDCTGHGVPGAMVSVVCSNALNRAVKEFGLDDPGMILNRVRQIVVETFEKSSGDVQDGMDISLLVLPSTHQGETFSAKWAGANNPIWKIRENKFHEIKGDKQPVGKYVHEKPFTTESIELKKGDQIYLITDGFGDQFGGPKGKKFKYKQLGQLILLNSSQPIDKQKELLVSAFESWKGELEQIDDVTVLGIRI